MAWNVAAWAQCVSEERKETVFDVYVSTEEIVTCQEGEREREREH